MKKAKNKSKKKGTIDKIKSILKKDIKFKIFKKKKSSSSKEVSKKPSVKKKNVKKTKKKPTPTKKTIKTAKKKPTKKKPTPTKKTAKRKTPKKSKVKIKQPKTSVKKSKNVVEKHVDNPIISPQEKSVWESWQTFNPASILVDGKVHFLYRAIGCDGISRFGYANSLDGFKVDDRHDKPVFQDSSLCSRGHECYSYASGGSWGGCEDPRIVRVGNGDKIYVIYTSCNGDLRVNISSIKVKDFLNKKWNWTCAKPISPPGEVHKNWVIFPEKINGKFAILHSLSPKISIDYVDSLEFEEGQYIRSHYSPSKKTKRWDSYMRGPGPTPVKTKHGWLLFYHAMSHSDMGSYKVGAMLLDLKDPTKILCRSKKPVLAPEEFYEMNGFKAGVVYALGATVKDGNIILYYGGADSYVCAAYADLNQFLKELIGKKVISKKTLKKKKK